MAAGRPIHTAALVISLRIYIRAALDLDPISNSVQIPLQGPTRPQPGGGRAARVLAKAQEMAPAVPRRTKDLARVDAWAVDWGAHWAAVVAFVSILRMKTGEKTTHPSGATPTLIAGRHRLEAARRLGWTELSCYVFEGRERDPAAAIAAQIAFVDENLIRRALSDAERAHLMARRKELYEAAHPETARGAVNQHTAASRKICEQQNVIRFTAATAKTTGRSERAVQREARRGEALGVDAVRVVGTSLDKGVELDALARLPQAHSAPLIELAAAGEAVSTGADSARRNREVKRVSLPH